MKARRDCFIIILFYMELEKAYDPKAAEEHHYQRWEENGYFTPELNQLSDAPKY